MISQPIPIFHVNFLININKFNNLSNFRREIMMTAISQNQISLYDLLPKQPHSIVKQH